MVLFIHLIFFLISELEYQKHIYLLYKVLKCFMPD